MAKDKDKKITVVAELDVTAADGTVEIVRSFDKAWSRMRELGAVATPVKVCFREFVKID